MKKLLLIAVLFLAACTEKPEPESEPVIEGPTFQEQIEEYLTGENVTIVDQVSMDEEVVLFYDDELVGMIQFVEEGFVVTENTLPIEGDKIEMLHIGDEEDTYFGVVFRDRELFEEGTEVVISLSTSGEHVVFDLTGEYQIIMMQYIEKSLTSCAADKVEVYNGDDLIYEESFIPV